MVRSGDTSHDSTSESPARRVETSARELLARLAAGDPLGMVARAETRLTSGCYLWDAEDLARRALALLVHRQLAERRVRRSAEFLAAALESALEERVFEASSDPRGERLVGQGLELRGLSFGVHGAALARACRAHNRCGLDARRAFRGLVIEGRGLDEVAHGLGLDAGRTARLAREVLLKFSQEIRTPGPREDVLDVAAADCGPEPQHRS